MKKIGLISDTHGCWDDRFAEYFASCDEVWHMGDVGTPEVADRFEALKPFRCVCGNIDGRELRLRYPEVLRFKVEEVEVLMKHIGGYPGRYDRSLRPLLAQGVPQLMLCGHSHILKVMFDPRLQMLHINPGAAGVVGFHKVRTLVRLVIDGQHMRDLEVIELGERAARPVMPPESAAPLVL